MVMFKYLFVLSSFLQLTQGLWLKHNNVCNSFLDYQHPDGNPNCYYDPETTLEAPQLIKKYAGVVETHKATSEDGYILTMFRIPRLNPKGVILFHHSIATFSHLYLWQTPDSLVFKLWKSGFDVWLTNHRGTTVSDEHVTLSKYGLKYWDFSFHEMGLYDVTAELELIRSRTNNSKVIFFGHSLGSTIGIVYASTKPEEAKNYLKIMVLLATPVYFDHATGAAMDIAKKLAPVFQNFLDTVLVGSPLLILPILIPVSRIFLRFFPATLFLVNVFVWILCGFTPSETDARFFNYDGAAYANNFSWKTLLHFAQLLGANHRFQMFDYGEKRNLEVYGTDQPPQYPIGNISVPTLLVSSHNDTLVNIKDVDALYEDLEPEARIDHWRLTDLNHLDYHLGLHRKEIFVDRFLRFLNAEPI